MSDENKDYDGIRYRVEKKSPLIFRILLAVLVVWAVGFMGYYLLGGWSSQGEYAQKKQAREALIATAPVAGAPAAGSHPEGNKEDSVIMGKKEFAERCASCHGAAAKGGIGPDLTRKVFKFGKSVTALTQTINEGRPGGMPSFKNDLSHEKVEGLVRYLLSL